MPRYYIEARSGESWDGKEFHGDPECSDLDDPSRPVPSRVAGEDADLCECVPFGDDSADASSDTDETDSVPPQSESSSEGSDGSDEDDGDSDADSPPTCAGTKANGEPCSREVDEEGDYCFQHSE